MPVLTDKNFQHNKPNVVVWNKAERTAQIIDVAVPMDRNVIRKYAEKITNYRDLEIEIQKCWDLKTVTTVPIIIGALGKICEGLARNLETISSRLRIQVVQKTALLGTARTLRNFLTAKGQSCFTQI